jgi:acetylornithine/N-succinyldiaminopimelate aminotransferase
MTQDWTKNRAVLRTSDPTILLDHAKGTEMWDDQGKRYLDFAAGIAVNSFGNVNDEIVDAAITQMKKLGHVSQTHSSAALEEASKLLVKLFGDEKAKVYWSNSGAEVNEGVFSAINRYQFDKGNKSRDQIITFKGAFHGRTGRTREAAGKYTEGIGALTGGFKLVEYNNIDAVKAAIDERTSGILVEPVQGEGGVLPADKSFLEGLRALCDEHDLVLAYDEVQTGIGRTGKIFAFENFGVRPDMITLAKALSAGVGVPLGVFIVSDKVNQVITEGGAKKFDHGSTFGGGPVAGAIVLKVLELIQRDEYTGAEAQERAAYFKGKLEALSEKYPTILHGVRGLGFMLALRLDHDIPNMEVIGKLREAGLFAMFAGDNVLRFLPPLNVSKAHIDEAADILDTVLADYAKTKHNQ